MSEMFLDAPFLRAYAFNQNTRCCVTTFLMVGEPGRGNGGCLTAVAPYKTRKPPELEAEVVLSLVRGVVEKNSPEHRGIGPIHE